MTYEQAIAYLLSLLGDIRGANFGLARMEALLARLGRPERSLKIVHVAGTNGKGSTCAMIEAGLRAAGYSTGLYSSPHLARFNERIRINGRSIDDRAFVAVIEEVRSAAEELVAAGGRAAHPTLFEILTAAGLCAFRRAGVDWTILEVGLGGRLDATNVVRPELAVITSIGLDHERWLGKGLPAIANEKAGILKPGCRAVFAKQEPPAAEALLRRAAELGIDAVQSGETWRAAAIQPDAAGRFSFAAVGPDTTAQVRLGLAGEHQIENALTAAAALHLLKVQPSAIASGLSGTLWPGRLELLEGDPPALLDCAHNPSGARTLARHLARFYSDRSIQLIYGTSRDKAVDEIAGLLFPLAETVVLTRSSVSRSVSPATLLRLLDHLHPRLVCAATVEKAVELARAQARPGSLLVAAGSIFLVGEARELFAGRVATPVSS